MNRRDLALAVAVLAACAAFLFIDLRPLPIQLWDDSRIAVSALEMRHHGLSLIATYEGAPDLWNTKPPLLVWLMAAVSYLTGPSELAVRLPSALAALGTLGLVMAFTRRVTGSMAAGALAAAILALSVEFFGEHGARTGDYDALLVLLTTGCLMALFGALHRRANGRDLALAAGLAVCAVMTKSIAGLVPLAGIGLYALLASRWRRLLSPAALAAGAVAALAVAGFYAAREAAAPGYVAAAWANDVSQRFLSALDRHAGPPWYYLAATATAWFSLGPLVLAAPLGLAGTRGKARLGLAFALCAAAGELAVVSFSSTKLPQYMAPAYPFLAIACAIAAWAGWRAAARRWGLSGRICAGALVAVVLAFAGSRAFALRYELLPSRGYVHQALYGELFAGLTRQGVARVVVSDRGVDEVGVPPGYSPQLRFYQLMWAERGMRVERAAPYGVATGDVVASCDAGLMGALLQTGARLEAPDGCVAVRR